MPPATITAPASASARCSRYVTPRHVQRASRRGLHVAAAATSSAPVSIFSPSKINLFLRVVRRREDGYHDLASLFHVIDLGDPMRFEMLPPTATQDVLTCSDTTIPTDASNLVIKALSLLRRKTGSSRHFAVHLEKRVPHGAGLGGGSGNAATTLYAANQMLGAPASNADLLTWSGEIGSDISVFFSLGSAYCTGRGEVVENVPPPLPLATPLLLVKPPVGLSTPAIFKSLKLDARSTADPRALLQSLASGGGMSQALAVNDLEQPAFDNLPELAQLKQRLIDAKDAKFGAVFMTGSGSTVVCYGSDQRPALLDDKQYKDLFVSPARLITRPSEDSWYQHSGMWRSS